MSDRVDVEKAYDSAIRAILTTFAAFSGFAIKMVLERVHLAEASNWFENLQNLWKLLFDAQFYIAVATVVLLLRFVIGSAVHLTLCFAASTPRKSRWLLSRDLAFLMIFGMLGALLTQTQSLETFEILSILFLAIGLAWSLIDGMLAWTPTAQGPTSFSLNWIMIDLAQVLGIIAIWYLLGDRWPASPFLAGLFALGLLADIFIVLPPDASDVASGAASHTAPAAPAPPAPGATSVEPAAPAV